jgi:RNA polymerase sigma-70 factor, ECF subfamily
VLTRCQEYDRSRPALPWAMAIAAWECRTLAKKRSRRRELPEEHAPELASGSEEELVHQQLLSAAVSSLGQLSEDDRAALVATFWEEAASVEGATLRKRRERALRRLRDTFKRLYGID